MAKYPPAVSEIQSRLAPFAYMARRTADELQLALDTARGEVELACPDAASGGLDERLDRAAWGICLDLAVWHLRWTFDRDSEGNIPKALVTARDWLDKRLATLAAAIAAGGGSGMMSFEPYEALDPVELPA